MEPLTDREQAVLKFLYIGAEMAVNSGYSLTEIRNVMKKLIDAFPQDFEGQ